MFGGVTIREVKAPAKAVAHQRESFNQLPAKGITSANRSLFTYLLERTGRERAAAPTQASMWSIIDARKGTANVPRAVYHSSVSPTTSDPSRAHGINEVERK